MTQVPPPKDITTQILISIRDEIRLTHEEIRGTNTRVDALQQEIRGTNSRMDTLREELCRRIVDSEIRTSTAIADLAGTVRDMTSVLRQQSDLRPRVERCESEIAALKTRLPA